MRDRTGFTLVKVVVATSVFATGVLATAGFVVRSAQLLAAVRRVDQEVVFVRQVVDSLAGGVTGSGRRVGDEGTVEWSVTGADGPLRRVDVVWTPKGRVGSAEAPYVVVLPAASGDSGDGS